MSFKLISSESCVYGMQENVNMLHEIMRPLLEPESECKEQRFIKNTVDENCGESFQLCCCTATIFLRQKTCQLFFTGALFLDHSIVLCDWLMMLDIFDFARIEM